jgi:hypothetical protein
LCKSPLEGFERSKGGVGVGVGKGLRVRQDNGRNDRHAANPMNNS